MELYSFPSATNSGKVGVEPVNYWDKGDCRTRIKGKGVMREGSPLIDLGLGISAGLGVNVSKQGKLVFTDKQLNELHQQALIHNYLVAGLSVPFHLILPIWKCVFSSFGSGNAGIHNHYPSFIGLCPQGFDYRSMMDPEPQRCRRTDGKKWRCSRNVIPDQKYCERHMHRGRQRSRKHVEASQNILKYDTKTTAKTISSNNTTPTTVSDNAYKNTRNTAKTITTSSANGMIRSNKNMYANNDPYARPPTIQTYNSNNESIHNVNLSLDTICTTTATTSNAVATDNNSSSSSRNRYSYTDGRDDGFIYIDDGHNISRSNCKSGNFVSPGFGFSPKSVLQGGTVVGCSSLAFGYGTLLETEPQRCRRTDGKKWRCSQDVIPDQKYCARHMHRGVKKVIVPLMSVTVAAAPPRPPLVTVAKKVNDYVNLNTNLSISIASSPQHKGDNDESSTSASCSDATTITDENMGVSQNLALSP